MGQKGTQSKHKKHDPIHQTQRATTLFQNRLNHQTNKVKKIKKKKRKKKTKAEGHRDRERKRKRQKRENDEWVYLENNELLRFLKENNHDQCNHRNNNNNINGWNQRNGSDKPEPDPTSYLGFVGSLFSLG